MKKDKIKVIYSSHFSEKENNIFNSKIESSIGVEHDIYCYPNFNEFSLANIYNKALNEHKSNNSILLYIHNDISFDTNNWGVKLLKHFNNSHNDYQIIGLAGVESLYSGCWWTNETNDGMNMKEMVGIVNHFNGIRKWTSKYSDSFSGVRPVVVIDGLFMAVDPNEIIHGFDEKFGKWHFYDLGFVFPNVLDGCNAGVITDIRITHNSIGETDQEWNKNKILFEKIYGNELPFKIKNFFIK